MPMSLPRFDVHQHLWPEPFLAALERRTAPPCLRRSHDGLTLVLAGEPEAPFDPAPHDPERRRGEIRGDGVDRVLVCMSCPLGVETLPRAEAQPVLDAWHDGVFALGDPFGVWGAVALDDPRGEDVSALLDRGAAGISLPAAAFATEARPPAPGRARGARPAAARPPRRGARGHPGAPVVARVRRLRRRAPRRLARLRRLGAPGPRDV